VFAFGSFQLDVANASLRRGKQALLLTPKAFNVLRYLVEHAGQLVTRDQVGRLIIGRDARSQFLLFDLYWQSFLADGANTGAGDDRPEIPGAD
jgi:DNA-binding response OmpR family regulator